MNPAARADELVADLDERGGKVEDHLWWKAEQEIDAGEGGRDHTPEPFGPVPGWDEPVAAVSEPDAGAAARGTDEAGAGRDLSPTGDRDAEDKGVAPAEDRGHADEALTEQTPEGTQLVVPGAERDEATSRAAAKPREQAEIEARQRQAKMRRLGQERVEDDEDGPFGEKRRRTCSRCRRRGCVA